MDAKEIRKPFPRVLCAALTLLVMALTLACVGARGEERTVDGKTDNGLAGEIDPKARHPIGKDDWKFDDKGNVEIKLKGYKKGDVLWLNKDGMDVSFYEDKDGVAHFNFIEEGTTNQLESASSGQLDAKTQQPAFKDAKEAFEKTLEKSKKLLKKKKKQDKSLKDMGYKTSNDGPSMPITLDLGVFLNGGDCHRNEGCHREPCRRSEPCHESRGFRGFRF